MYKTHSTLKNKIKAARLMNEINKRVLVLLKLLIKNNEHRRPEVQRLLNRYDWDKMMENSPFNFEGTTSYMEDKGKKFAICLRNKNGEFLDINTLMFVTLHELSHLMTPVKDDHDEYFNNCFRYICQWAIKAKVYVYQDYTKNPINYCGLMIRSSPV